jgi:hypothetical protein
MRSFLTLAVMITDNILTSYKTAGEEEVSLSYEYKSNSVTIEVIYPKHVDQLYSGLLALSNQLKFENQITEFNLSISSSKLKVSLFR